MEFKQSIEITSDIYITFKVTNNAITKIKVGFRDETSINFKKDMLDKIPTLIKMWKLGIYVYHLYEVEICHILLANGAKLYKPITKSEGILSVPDFYDISNCIGGMKTKTINKHIVDYLLNTPDWFGLYYDGFKYLVDKIGVKKISHEFSTRDGSLEITFNDNTAFTVDRGLWITMNSDHLHHFSNINPYIVKLIQNHLPSNRRISIDDLNGEFECTTTFEYSTFTNNYYKVYYNYGYNVKTFLQLIFSDMKVVELLSEEKSRYNFVELYDNKPYVEVNNSTMQRLSRYIDIDDTFANKFSYILCYKQFTEMFYEKIVTKLRQKYGNFVKPQRENIIHSLSDKMDIVINIQ